MEMLNGFDELVAQRIKTLKPEDLNADGAMDLLERSAKLDSFITGADKDNDKPVQKKALELLSSSGKHILLFGGSHSGKTTVLVMAVIFRACRYPGSRHLICRFRAKDARSSVLHETLILWLNKTIGAKNYKANVRDGFLVTRPKKNMVILSTAEE